MPSDPNFPPILPEYAEILGATALRYLERSEQQWAAGNPTKALHYHKLAVGASVQHLPKALDPPWRLLREQALSAMEEREDLLVEAHRAGGGGLKAVSGLTERALREADFLAQKARNADAIAVLEKSIEQERQAREAMNALQQAQADAGIEIMFEEIQSLRQVQADVEAKVASNLPLTRTEAAHRIAEIFRADPSYGARVWEKGQHCRVYLTHIKSSGKTVDIGFIDVRSDVISTKFLTKDGAKIFFEDNVPALTIAAPPNIAQDDQPSPAQASQTGDIWVERGEGYGGEPYTLGQKLRHTVDGKQGWCVVVQAKQRYCREDGLSFGVGDDRGYIYSAKLRLATDEEAVQFDQEVAEVARLKAERAEKLARVKAIHQQVKSLGDRPERADWPAGETLFSSRRDYFHVTEQGVWALIHNGADGDDWAYNNLPGAIGWFLHDPDLAQELRDLSAALSGSDTI